MKTILCLFAALLFTVIPAIAMAAENGWTVVRTAGQANFTLDKSNWTAVQKGTVIPNKAWILTGSRGRLILSRGQEKISFQPNTLAAIRTTGLMTRKTEIVQQVGTLDLDIEKRSRPHTYVTTPFLAAVVKGTSFQVVVTKARAAIKVSRGLVQVRSFESGQQSDVGPDQSVTVDPKKGMTVSGEDAVPTIVSVSPTSAKLPAIGSVQQSQSANSSDSAGNGTVGAAVSSSEKQNNSESDNGKSNGQSSGNTSGDSDKSDNGNAKANGNASNGSSGNGSANGNSSGNSNGNGQGNGNANGNSSKSETGTGNSSSSNNGNGNANGNGNGNGKSSGNSNGNGNGNNGNGKSGNSGNKDKDKDNGKNKDKDDDDDD